MGKSLNFGFQNSVFGFLFNIENPTSLENRMLELPSLARSHHVLLSGQIPEYNSKRAGEMVLLHAEDAVNSAIDMQLEMKA